MTATGIVRVVRLLSKADSKTERLCILLTLSNSHQCIARTYVPYPAAALHPQIETSEKYGISAFIPFLPTVSCSTGFGFQSFASTLCVHGTCVGVHRAIPLIGETKQAMT